MCFRQLLVERLGGVEFEGLGRFADGDRRRFLVHLLSLQVALQRIQEQAIVGHAVPVKHLLLLLGSDTVVFVQKVEERTLRFFQSRIGASLEVSQIGKDTLLKLLGVFDGATERLKSESEASNDICAGNMEKVAPAARN